MARIAILYRVVAQDALVRILLGSFGMGLLGPVGDVGRWPQIEARSMTRAAFARSKFADGSMRDAVAVKARFHGRHVRLARLMGRGYMARSAAHHEVVTVAEHQPGNIRLA